MLSNSGYILQLKPLCICCFFFNECGHFLHTGVNMSSTGTVTVCDSAVHWRLYLQSTNRLTIRSAWQPPWRTPTWGRSWSCASSSPMTDGGGATSLKPTAGSVGVPEEDFLCVSSSGKVCGYSDDFLGDLQWGAWTLRGDQKLCWTPRKAARSVIPAAGCRCGLPKAASDAANEEGRFSQLLEMPFVNSHLLNQSVCQSEVQNMK